MGQFGSKSKAIAAEKKLIKQHSPPANIQHRSLFSMAKTEFPFTPVLRNLPVTVEIHAVVKRDAARLGKLQYIHTGDIIIAGRRALSLKRNQPAK